MAGGLGQPLLGRSGHVGVPAAWVPEGENQTPNVETLKAAKPSCQASCQAQAKPPKLEDAESDMTSRQMI